jgi:hypothetical protein
MKGRRRPYACAREECRNMADMQISSGLVSANSIEQRRRDGPVNFVAPRPRSTGADLLYFSCLL